MGKEVTAKIYYDSIIIYSNLNIVCEHKKIDEIIDVLIPYSSTNVISFSMAKSKLDMDDITRSQTNKYNDLCIRGGLPL